MKEAPEVSARNRAAWRRWLAKNHATSGPVWLVFAKKDSGLASVDYEEAVLEALCFGWIDSLVRRRDEKTYAQLFSPRKKGSNWSASNRARIERLEREGLITDAGRAVIDFDASAPPPERPGASMPVELARLLEDHRDEKAFFESLAPSHRRATLGRRNGGRTAGGRPAGLRGRW